MSHRGRVKLLFFGPVHDAVGARQVDFEIESPHLSDMLSKLKEQYPQLENSKLLIALNEEYADAEAILNDGDEVAIFTPVSGG